MSLAPYFPNIFRLTLPFYLSAFLLLSSLSLSLSLFLHHHHHHPYRISHTKTAVSTLSDKRMIIRFVRAPYDRERHQIRHTCFMLLRSPANAVEVMRALRNVGFRADLARDSQAVDFSRTVHLDELPFANFGELDNYCALLHSFFRLTHVVPMIDSQVCALIFPVFVYFISDSLSLSLSLSICIPLSTPIITSRCFSPSVSPQTPSPSSTCSTRSRPPRGPLCITPTQRRSRLQTFAPAKVLYLSAISIPPPRLTHTHTHTHTHSSSRLFHEDQEPARPVAGAAALPAALCVGRAAHEPRVVPLSPSPRHFRSRAGGVFAGGRRVRALW